MLSIFSTNDYAQILIGDSRASNKCGVFGYRETDNVMYMQCFGDSYGDGLQIADGGKIGIGTTSPSNDFVISNGGANGMEFGAGGSTSTLDVFNRSTSAYTPFSITTSAFTVDLQGGNMLISGGQLDIGGRAYNSSSGGFYMNDGRIQNTVTADSSGYEVMMFDNTIASGTVALLQYRTNATAEGSIVGNSSGLSISNNSDYRKKERITDLEGSLDAINSLQPREYYYREEFAKPTRAFAGFIAHEVQESQLSHLTTGSKDGVVTQKDLDNDLYSEKSVGEPIYQTVAYSDNEMITRLVGAVQELSAKVEALENA